jgi:hypothetical protein
MRTALLILVMFLAACSTHQVKGETTPGVDFSSFRSYAWLPASEERPPDEFANNPATDRFIRREIDENMAKAGYGRVASDADLLVSYVTGITDILGETYWGRGYGGTSGGDQSITLRNRRDVTLLVTIVTAESREVVWRGSARTTFDTMESPDERAVKIIAALFEELPRASSER